MIKLLNKASQEVCFMRRNANMNSTIRNTWFFQRFLNNKAVISLLIILLVIPPSFFHSRFIRKNRAQPIMMHDVYIRM